MAEPLFAYDSSRHVLVLFALRQPNGAVPGVEFRTLKQNGWLGSEADYAMLPRVGAQPQSSAPPIQVAPDMEAARRLASSLKTMKQGR